MGDEGKTKEQLVNELRETRQRIAEMKALVTERARVEEEIERVSSERTCIDMDAVPGACFPKDRNNVESGKWYNAEPIPKLPI